MHVYLLFLSSHVSVYPVYSLKKTTLHSHSVGKTQWFLQTGVTVGTSCILVGQHAVPDAEDLCWPHLWIWQQDDRSGFALPSPCFIAVDFFSRDRSRDQPLYWVACLVLSSGWLTHDKLGRWWKRLGYSPSFMHWSLGWLLQVSILLAALVRGRVQRFASVWITKQLNDYFFLLKVEAAPVQWYLIITAASCNMSYVTVCKCSSDLIYWKTSQILVIC